MKDLNYQDFALCAELIETLREDILFAFDEEKATPLAVAHLLQGLAQLETASQSFRIAEIVQKA